MSRNDAKPLTMLWRRTSLQFVPESFFIERILFGALGRPVRVIALEAITDAPFGDDILVVSLGTEFAPYLAEARRRGHRNLILFHLGDEQAQQDLSFYAWADLVFRNYWFEQIFTDPKICWVPNGYALGVGPAGPLLRAADRSVAGFFAGAVGQRVLSDERGVMKQVVEAAGLPFRLHVTAALRDRLSPAVYAAALGNARFALVPGGNSPETIRLYDAMEMGAIPIMLRSAFVAEHEALDNPPILLLDRWEELPTRYVEWAAGDLDARQAAVIAWWSTFKTRQQRRVADRVNALPSL